MILSFLALRVYPGNIHWPGSRRTCTSCSHYLSWSALLSELFLCGIIFCWSPHWWECSSQPYVQQSWCVHVSEAFKQRPATKHVHTNVAERMGCEMHSYQCLVSYERLSVRWSVAFKVSRYIYSRSSSTTDRSLRRNEWHRRLRLNIKNKCIKMNHSSISRK